VSRALDVAARGADLAALDFALSQAAKAGVPEERLEAALRRKRALEGKAAKVRSQRARHEASEVLQQAAGTGNADMLASAVGAAEQLGLPSAELQAARVRLSALEAEARGQRVRTEAVIILRAAFRGLGSEPLPESLLRASRAGLTAEQIQDVAAEGEQGMSRAGAAARVLDAAMRGSSTELLQLALGWAAAAGVDEALLAVGRERAVVLEEVLAEDALRDRILNEAAQALTTAWQRGEPDALAAAIERAATAGVSEEMLRLARRRHASLMKRPAWLRGKAAAAEPEAAADATAAETIAREVEEAAADTPAAVAAREAQEAEAKRLRARLEEATQRQQACAEASRALHFAMVGGGAEELQAAIEEATRLGVSRENVARAKRKLGRVLASG